MVESIISVNPILRNTFRTPIQRAVVRNCPSLNFCFMSAKNPGFALVVLPDSIAKVLRYALQKMLVLTTCIIQTMFFAEKRSKNKTNKTPTPKFYFLTAARAEHNRPGLCFRPAARLWRLGGGEG